MSDPRDPVGRTARATGADLVERLWPSAPVWLATLVMAGFCGVVGLPFGQVQGAVAFIVSEALLGILLLRSSPEVGVRAGEFVAGRAHVPLSLIGEATALDAEQLRKAHGPGLDARAYLCLRGWVHAGLRLDLVDPQDPTPYWIVTCRRPEAMLAALLAQRDAG